MVPHGEKSKAQNRSTAVPSVWYQTAHKQSVNKQENEEEA